MQRSSAFSTPYKHPPNGVFEDGVWLCNCTPRLPASHYQVRKDSPNKGRWFFTCPNPPNSDTKCNFFLWIEEAQKRELDGVPATSSQPDNTPSHRPEKRQRTIQESINPAQGRQPGPGTPSGTVQSSVTVGRSPIFIKQESSLSDKPMADLQPALPLKPTPTAAGKRKRSDHGDYNDFSSGEEEELIVISSSSSRGPTDTGKPRNAFETPTTSTRPRADTGNADGDGDAVITPLTERPVRRILFSNGKPSSPSSSSRPRLLSSIPRLAPPAMTSPPSSPETPRANANPASSPSGAHNTPSAGRASGIAREIVPLLEAQGLGGRALRDVRAALERHAAQAMGLERGRDASRDAARRAEARVAELETRVRELEDQRRIEAEMRQTTLAALAQLDREG